MTNGNKMKEIDLKTVLVDMMTKRKISQRELSKMMEISEARVSQMFSKSSKVSWKTIERVAAVLNFDLSIKLNDVMPVVAADTMESVDRGISLEGSTTEA